MNAYLLKWVFVILHIVTAAAWFGMGLRLAAQARLVLNLAASAAPAVAAYVGRTVRLMGIFVVLTLLFAITAFVLGGAFSAYGWPYHTSLLLILVLTAVQFFLVQPSWTRLEATLGQPDVAKEHYKRLTMGVGVGHLVWLLLLVLMFVYRFRGGMELL